MPANGTVDERIVEMRIDHQKFESGAKKTISILESLDKGLKSLGKNNTDGFDGIASSLDKVTNKISVFGTIGDQVIRTLTNKAMELVGQMGKLANTLTIDQIAAGWDKYAEKTQGVQTIMAATAQDWEDQGAQMEWVNEQLEKLNWFTDETSYNFLDMVNNIGKFTSSGVKLETAVTAMEGISTWAAISGANTQEASRAMYNLSQAMSMGVVLAQDWKSIELANMATLEFKQTALEAAVALGTLEKAGDGVYKIIGKDSEDAYFTAEQFRSTLSEKWFTSDVLLETLDKYGAFTDALNEETLKLDMTATEFLSAMEAYKEGNMEELALIAKRTNVSVETLKKSVHDLSGEEYDLGYRAFKAAQEAKTFKEAIDATKDAVSTGWMNIWETIFGNYLEAKELWTDLAETLYNVFAEPVNSLIDLIDRAFNFNGIEESAEAAVDPTSELGEYLLQAGLDATRFVQTLNEINPDLGQEIADKYGDIDAAFKAGAIDAETFRKILERLAEYGSGKQFAVSGRIGEEINLENQSIVSEEAAKRLEAYNYLLENGTELLDHWTEKVTEASNVGEEKVPGGQLFREGLMELMDTINNFVVAFNEAMDLVFGGTDSEGNIIPWTDVAGDKLYDLIVRFREFVDRIKISDEDIESLSERLSGTINTFRTIGSIFGTVFSIIGSVISLIWGAIKQSGILGSIFRGLLSVIEALISPISTVVTYISSALKVQESLGNITWPERLASGLSKIGTFIENAANKFKEFMQSEQVVNALVNGILALQGAFGKISAFLQPIFDKISGFFTRLSTLIKFGFERNGIVGVFENLKAAFDSFLAEHPAISFALNTLKTIIETLSSVIMLAGYGIFYVISQVRTFISYITDSLSNGGLLGIFNSLFDKLRDTFSENTTIVNFLSDLQKGFIFIGNAISGIIGRIGSLKAKLDPIIKLIQLGFKRKGFEGAFENLHTYFKLLLLDHPGLMKFFNAISSAFSTIGKVVASAYESVRNFITSIDFSSLISKLPSLDEIGAFFSGIFNSIVTWFRNIKEKIKSGDFSGAIKGIGESIANAFQNAKSFFEPIKNALANLLKKLNIREGFLQDILDYFKDGTEVLKGLALVGLIRAIKKVVNTFGEILSSLSGFGKAAKVDAIGNTILKVSASLLLIAAALWVIAKIPADQMTAVVWTLIDVLGVLWAVVMSMKMMDAGNELKGMAAFLAALALMLLSAIYVMKEISKMSPLKFLGAFVGLFLILALIVTFMAFTKDFKGDGFKTLLGVAILLLAIVHVMKEISKMSVWQFLGSFIAISLILAVIAGFMVLINGFNSPTGFKTLLGVVILLLAVVYVMKAISKMSVWQFLGSFIAISLILAVIAGFMVLINGFGVGKGALLTLLLTIGLIAVVAYSLKQLAKENWKSLLAASVSMMLCLVAVGAVIATLSIFGSSINPLALVSLAVGIAALFAVSLVLKSLAGFDWTAILGAAIVCSLTLVALIGILALAGVAGGTMIAGAVILGVALIILTGAIWIIAEIADSIMDSVVSVAEKLSLFIEKLAPFLASVSSISDAEVEGAKKLRDMMGALLIGQAFSLAGSWLDGLNAEYGTKLSDFMTSLEGFLSSVGTVNDAQLSGAGCLSLIMGVLLGGEAWGKIGDFVNGLNAETGQKLSDFMNGMQGFLENVSSIDESKLEGASNLTSIMQKAFGANFWGTIGDWFSGNNVEYAEKMSAFTGALVPFLTNISAIDTGVLEKARSAMTTFSIWNQDNTIANFGAQIDQFYNKLNGKNAGGDLTGLQSAISMFTEFADAITKLSGIDGIPAGLSIIDSVDDGIKAGSANLTLTLIVTIQNAVNDIGGGVYDAAYSNGLAIGDGTAAGIYASTGAAVAAVVAMATAINEAFSTILDIHSPSRVFRRLAGFIPAGVAEGIEDKTWMAEDSITILASGVVAAMQQAMARVAMIADEDFDISPRITPVVDMSNLTSAAGNAGSLFDNIGTRMRGSMRVSMDTAQNTASAMKYGSGTDTIVDEIQRLSTRLEQLGDAVTGMQIVLDTGTLVGATSRKMDNAFGVMQARKGRGN